MTEATATEMNEMFKDYEGSTEGFEDMSQDTQSVPFLRLLQDMSPAVKKKHADYVDGAEPGMLINTATNKLYPLPLKFVVGKFERYYIEWGADRAGFKGAHAVELIDARIGTELIVDDGYKIVDPKTGNSFSDTYVYYVIFPDHIEDGVCILSLSSSQLKEAKKLNRNLRSTMIPNTKKRALPFFMVWSYSVVDMSNDKGAWSSPKFEMDSFVTQELLDHVTSERKTLEHTPVDFNLLEDNSSKSSSFKPVSDDEDVKY